jgi:hypothetical protein
MLSVRKRRILGYVVVITAVVALLVSLQTAAVDVTLDVDLSAVRYADGQPLTEVAVRVLDESGAWIASSVQSFPQDLWPSGPPAAAAGFPLKLKKGQYEVRVALAYGPDKRKPLDERRQLVTVEAAGKLHASAGFSPAVPALPVP